MARNASGTHSLPAGNPVVTATTIAVAWANDTLNDLSAEITDSLSRSGKGPMQAPLENVDGTVAAPAVTFDSETNSGLYRVGAGDIRFGILAALVQKWTAAGIDITGAITASTSGTATTSWISDLFTANTATSATLKGKVADGATAVGVILDNSNALANAGAKSVSVRHNNVEKAYFGVDGKVVTDEVRAFTANSPLTLTSDENDSAGAVAFIVNTAQAITTAGAKLWSLRTNTTEKAYIDKDGRYIGAAVGQQVSASCGAFTTTSAAYADITNLSVTLTTVGRPVMVMLNAGTDSYVGNSGANTVGIAFDRGGANIATWFTQVGAAGEAYALAPIFLDVVGAGTYTYKARAKTNAGTATVNDYKLVAYEL